MCICKARREQIGFQHGYLLANEIEDNVLVYQVEAAQHTPSTNGAFFATPAKNVLWPHLDAEYQAGAEGHRGGLASAGIDA